MTVKQLRGNPVFKTKLVLSILCLSTQGMISHAYARNSIAESNVFASDTFSTEVEHVDAPIETVKGEPVKPDAPAPKVADAVVPASVAKTASVSLPVPDIKSMTVAPVPTVTPVATPVPAPTAAVELKPAVLPAPVVVPDSVATVNHTQAAPVAFAKITAPTQQEVKAAVLPDMLIEDKHTTTTPPVANVAVSKAVPVQPVVDTPASQPANAVSNEMEQRINSLGASLTDPSHHDTESQTTAGVVIFTSPAQSLVVPQAQLDNGKKLVATILKKKLLKNEFETESQFKNRLGSEGSKLSYFVTDNVIDGLKYDPEKQQFTVHQWVVTTHSSEPLNAYFKMPLTEVPKRVDGCIGYVGDVQNGKFGGVIIPELHVFVKNASQNRSLRAEDEPYIVGTYAVDAQTAKLDKDNLKLLLIGDADIANLSFGYKRVSPNMEISPFISNVQYQIPFQLAGVYLYNARTKRIVAPLSIQNEHFSPLLK